VSPRRREHAPGPTAASTLSDALRSRILGGDIAPGAPLREEELATSYSVSRHTVRSALAALASERLVTSEPYRGARVAQLDDAALVALQDLRGALEAEAVRLVRERHGERWPAEILAPIDSALRALAAADAAAEWQRTTLAHADLHQAIVAAAGSPRITQTYAQLDAEILLLLNHVRPDYPSGRLAREHRRDIVAMRRQGGSAVHAHLARSTALIRAARGKPPDASVRSTSTTHE
jgi:DNA-binding GntR family transcriptional regulator